MKGEAKYQEGFTSWKREDGPSVVRYYVGKGYQEAYSHFPRMPAKDFQAMTKRLLENEWRPGDVLGAVLGAIDWAGKAPTVAKVAQGQPPSTLVPGLWAKLVHRDLAALEWVCKKKGSRAYGKTYITLLRDELMNATEANGYARLFNNAMGIAGVWAWWIGADQDDRPGLLAGGGLVARIGAAISSWPALLQALAQFPPDQLKLVAERYRRNDGADGDYFFQSAREQVGQALVRRGILAEKDLCKARPPTPCDPKGAEWPDIQAVVIRWERDADCDPGDAWVSAVGSRLGRETGGLYKRERIYCRASLARLTKRRGPATEAEPAQPKPDPDQEQLGEAPSSTGNAGVDVVPIGEEMLDPDDDAAAHMPPAAHKIQPAAVAGSAEAQPVESTGSTGGAPPATAPLPVPPFGNHDRTGDQVERAAARTDAPAPAPAAPSPASSPAAPAPAGERHVHVHHAPPERKPCFITKAVCAEFAGLRLPGDEPVVDQPAPSPPSPATPTSSSPSSTPMALRPPLPPTRGDGQEWRRRARVHAYDAIERSVSVAATPATSTSNSPIRARDPAPAKASHPGRQGLVAQDLWRLCAGGAPSENPAGGRRGAAGRRADLPPGALSRDRAGGHVELDALAVPMSPQPFFHFQSVWAVPSRECSRTR